MAILKEGRYLGKFEDDGLDYHMFAPEEIGTEGEVKYVRIGDRKDEFSSNRKYILLNVNKTEQKLIDETTKKIKESN